VIKTDALVASGISARLAQGLLIENKSQSIPTTDALAGLLKRMKIRKESKMPISAFTRVQATEDSSPWLKLSMRVPQLAPDNGGARQNLALLIKFACTLTGADQNRVHVITDASLGDTVLLPAFQQRLLNDIVVAGSSSQGVSTSEVYTIKGSYKLNPCEMLGCIKTLNSHYSVVRRASGPKSRAPEHLEVSELREAYNTHCGLKAQNAGWVLDFIKETLAYSVRPTTEGFPGGFIHAAKVRLGAKTSDGLLLKLGWVPLAPSLSKLTTVLRNTVATNEAGKISLASLPTDAVMDYSEHRTAVALCLPRIDPKSPLPMEEQIRKDPMNISQGSVKFYRLKKTMDLIDALVLSYNIYVAVPDTKKPATAEHFKNVRGETLRRSAFVPLIDATGTEYSSFKEIPESVRNYLLKRFPWKQGVSKRARSKSPSHGAKAPEEETQAGSSNTTIPDTGMVVDEGASAPPPKKQKASQKDASFAADLVRTRGDPRVARASADLSRRRTEALLRAGGKPATASRVTGTRRPPQPPPRGRGRGRGRA
jgi:hypothetical protein